MTPFFQLPVTFQVDNGLQQPNCTGENHEKNATCCFISCFGFEHGSGPEDHSCGRNLPVSHLLQVVHRVQRRASGVQINYQSIGSGGGIKQVCSGTVDFGASDMPMTDQLLASCGVKLIHIPTVSGRGRSGLQCARCQRPISNSANRARGHLPGQDHAAGTIRASPRTIRAFICPTRRSSSSIAPMEAAPPSSGPTS